MREDWFWKDGKLLQEGQIPISNGAFQHGMGLFETLFLHEGSVFFFKEHLQRLRKGAAFFQFELPYTDEEYFRALQQLCAHGEKGTARLKLLVTASHTHYGAPLIPTSSVLTLSPYERSTAPLSLLCTPFVPQQLNHYKSTNYAAYILAKREALLKGADEALLFNSEREIIECTSGNFFFERGKSWYTPSLELGALAGTQRAAVIHSILATSLSLTEGAYHPEMAEQRAFMTNSLGAIIPIQDIDKRPLEQFEVSSLPFYDAWTQCVNDAKTSLSQGAITVE